MGGYLQNAEATVQQAEAAIQAFDMLRGFIAGIENRLLEALKWQLIYKENMGQSLNEREFMAQFAEKMRREQTFFRERVDTLLMVQHYRFYDFLFRVLFR